MPAHERRARGCVQGEDHHLASILAPCWNRGACAQRQAIRRVEDVGPQGMSAQRALGAHVAHDRLHALRDLPEGDLAQSDQRRDGRFGGR